MEQPRSFTATLQVSEYDIEEGVVAIEGEIQPEATRNGSAPEFVKTILKVHDIKAVQHLGAWVHVAIEKDWYVDLLFEDADEASKFYSGYYNALVDFYAAQEPDGYDDEPGIDLNGRGN